MRRDKNKNFTRLFWFFIFLIILFSIHFALVKQNRRGTTCGAPTTKIQNNHKKQYYPELRVKEENKAGKARLAPTTKNGSVSTGRKQNKKGAIRNIETIEIKPAIVIVIDDFGYNYKTAEDFARLEMPITFSILPNLAYSGKIAFLANSSGKQVMLHLPMEPYSGQRIEKSMIMSGMTREEIGKTFNEDMNSVPFAVGVNNHEGSKATENYFVMKAVLEECKKRYMFYLDSMTAYSSRADDAGRELNMKINRRDIFLDNENNMDYIIGNLEKLKKIAEKNGFAVGIGHARTNTAQALKKFYDGNKGKIDFVFMSELYK